MKFEGRLLAPCKQDMPELALHVEAGKTVTRFETVFAHLARVDDQEPITGRTIEQVVPH